MPAASKDSGFTEFTRLEDAGASTGKQHGGEK